MTLLRQLWARWRRFGQIIGDLIARIVLSLFYFTIFAPFATGVRLLADPLAIHDTAPNGWIARSDEGEEELAALRGLG